MNKIRHYCAYCGVEMIEGAAWLHENGRVTHVECKEGYKQTLYPYGCPKCETKGVIHEYNDYIYRFKAEGEEREIYALTPDMVCPLCEGVGYLKQKPVPIDWKLEVEDD